MCYICAELGEVGPAHVHSLVGRLVSGNPQGSRLCASLGLPLKSLPSLPELVLMLRLGSLHLFPSGVGWGLSEVSYASYAVMHVLLGLGYLTQDDIF